MLTFWYIFGRKASVYICDICRSHVGTRYHCTLCMDFDLCITCYEENKHEHTMEKRDVELYDSQLFRPPVLRNINHSLTPKARKLFVIKLNRIIVHTDQCEGCDDRTCNNVKRLKDHGELCKFRRDDECPIFDRYYEVYKYFHLL